MCVCCLSELVVPLKGKKWILKKKKLWVTCSEESVVWEGKEQTYILYERRKRRADRHCVLRRSSQSRREFTFAVNFFVHYMGDICTAYEKRIQASSPPGKLHLCMCWFTWEELLNRSRVFFTAMTGWRETGEEYSCFSHHKRTLQKHIASGWSQGCRDILRASSPS